MSWSAWRGSGSRHPTIAVATSASGSDTISGERDLDMVLDFTAVLSGLVIGDTKACVSGTYLDRATRVQFRFFGCDKVIVEPK